MTESIYAAKPWTALLSEAQRAPSTRPRAWSTPSGTPPPAAPGTPRSPTSTDA